jgi:hypothetical protein
MAIFFSLNIVFFLVVFLFVFVVFTGCISCVFVPLLPSSLVLFIFGAGFVGIFWRAGSYFPCVCVAPLCGVSGRYNLFEC